MKKLLIILSILFFAFVIFVNCKASPEKLIIGTWEAEKPDETNTTKMVINQDGTYQGYGMKGDPAEEVQITSGTWLIEGSGLTINIEEEYDISSGQLEPIDMFDVEKKEFSFSVTETKLTLPIYLGGNTETLVGTWELHSLYYDYESDTPDSFDSTERTLVLNEDGSYYFTIDSESDSGEGWIYEDDKLLIPVEGLPNLYTEYEVSFVGNGLILSTGSFDLSKTYTKSN